MTCQPLTSLQKKKSSISALIIISCLAYISVPVTSFQQQQELNAVATRRQTESLAGIHWNPSLGFINPKLQNSISTFSSPKSTLTTTRLFSSDNDNNNNNSNNAFPDVERPDPSILLAAKDANQQKLGIAAIGVGILGGTVLLVDVLHTLQLLLPGFFDVALSFLVPLPLGLLYAALGATHFVYKDAYAQIVPPKDTWGGLWQVPAPYADKLNLSYEDYHVIWTGVAEIGGGLLFALGGLNAVPIQFPAFLLFFLTLAVTPANVYMFTHDAQLSVAPPFPYPEGHIFRGVMQCVLLSLFWFFAFYM